MLSKANKSSHAVYSIQLHVVFVTKYRKNVITPEIMQRIGEVFQRVCMKGKSKMLEFNGEEDHVHLLLDVHPDNNISQLMASLKSASSRIVRSEFAEHVNSVYWKPVFWSGSYYVSSTGGAPIERIRQYIQAQGESEM